MTVCLTPTEQRMLAGKEGEAKRLAMEVLVKLADSLGAESFVPVVSVQAMAHFGSLHQAGLDWYEKLAAAGGCCCVPTTQDPASISFQHWQELGLDADYVQSQLKLKDAALRLGEYHSWSCTPYFQGSLPRFGQNVAWAESSAVSFANSVLGARTNRTGAGVAVCAALTGRMPKYGLYMEENRRATVKITVEATLSDLDYNTLGILVGKLAGTDIPAIYGIPESATNDNLKYLGAAAASSGSVALYHAVGVTPEAFRNDPFDGKAPQREALITRRDLDEAAQKLTTAKAGAVDLVVVGCPHYSMEEMVLVAKLLKGKKLKPGKKFWIYTTQENENMLERMGLRQHILASGARILAQNCLVISPLPGHYGTLMTDSGKFASYLPSEHRVELRFGSMADCVQSVTE